MVTALAEFTAPPSPAPGGLPGKATPGSAAGASSPSGADDAGAAAFAAALSDTLGEAAADDEVPPGNVPVTPDRQAFADPLALAEWLLRAPIGSAIATVPQASAGKTSTSGKTDADDAPAAKKDEENGRDWWDLPADALLAPIVPAATPPVDAAGSPPTPPVEGAPSSPTSAGDETSVAESRIEAVADFTSAAAPDTDTAPVAPKSEVKSAPAHATSNDQMSLPVAADTATVVAETAAPSTDGRRGSTSAVPPSTGAVPPSTGTEAPTSSRGAARSEERPIQAEASSVPVERMRVAETASESNPRDANDTPRQRDVDLSAISSGGLATPASPLSTASEAAPSVVPVAIPHIASPTATVLTTVAEPSMSATMPPSTDAENAARLIQSMRVQVRDGLSEATVRLRPEHLGEVNIAIQVSGTSVTATVHADAAGVRDWLQTHEQTLRTSLAEQGLQLDRYVVAREKPTPERQPGDGGRQQQPQQEQPRRRWARRQDDESNTFELSA